MIAAGQPGFNFNQASIDANAPSQSGVYALYNHGWVYIGESNDIRRRLHEHLNDPRIMRYQPTGFCFELARQDALIAQLNPSANRM
jgi:hypothetical protein